MTYQEILEQARACSGPLLQGMPCVQRHGL